MEWIMSKLRHQQLTEGRQLRGLLGLNIWNGFEIKKINVKTKRVSLQRFKESCIKRSCCYPKWSTLPRKCRTIYRLK
jgi:hypothetical protein